MIYLRIKIYAHKREWNKIEELINEKNKKSILIPYEDVAELAI